MERPSSATLKEGILLAVLKAAALDFVPTLHDCFVHDSACFYVMSKGDKTLDDCLKATVSALPATVASDDTYG